MKARRFAVAIGLALLFTGWARAGEDMSFATDPFGPYFYIDLFPVPGNGEWNTGASFNVVAMDTSVPNPVSDGYTPTSFCPSQYVWECIHEPGGKFEGGSDPATPIQFDQSAMFSIPNGAVPTIKNYINTGQNIETIVLTTTDFNTEDIYTCSSDLFSFCGFKVTDGAPTLNLIFTQPIYPGGIPTAVPEPAQYILFLTVLGIAVAAHRMRTRRVRA
jgi:hypothetical protein